MASGQQAAVLQDFDRLFTTGSLAGLSDAQLLERFASRRDQDAFAALVERLGPMVLGACRRRLRDAHDVEDAFQAAFLVLVRRAGSIPPGYPLGAWLHGVTLRVATRAARRRAREPIASTEGEPAAGAIPADLADLRAILDEEIHRLPEPLRVPVILCHLEGRTYEEAARQLRWSVDTVRGRLARARERLRGRLTRRGLAPTAGLLAAALAPESASAAVPAAIVNATATAAMRFAGFAGTTEAVASSSVSLAKGALRHMFWNRLRTTAFASLLIVGLGGAGAFALARQAPAPRTRPAAGQPTQAYSAPARAAAPAGKQPTNPATAAPARRSRIPYIAEPPDLLRVEVLEALPGRPITGDRLIRPDGTISLGFYGDVEVAGLTLPQVKEKVVNHLRTWLTDEALGLLWLSDINDPDSKRVIPQPPGLKTPLPPAEALRWAIRNTDRVFIDVSAYNSKVYYVEGCVVSPGRLPWTGNDTVLDAIHYAGGPTDLAACDKIRLMRPGPPGSPAQTLPIKYFEITGGADVSTNYELQPGDRLVVPWNPDIKPEPGHADATALKALEFRMQEVERKLDRLLKAMEESKRPSAPETTKDPETPPKP